MFSVVKVNPGILPPSASGRAVPVEVFGTIASTHTSPPKGFFFVTDEYRAVEPGGRVALSPYPVSVQKIGPTTLYSFGFSFSVSLQAKRSTSTPDGRHYNVFVGGTDAEGSDGRTVSVLVPKVYPPRPLPTGPARHALGRPVRRA